MNEQAQKILLDLIQKATSGIDSAVAFSQAQIPDVIHQMLVWKLTESLVHSLMGVCLLVATFFVCRLVCKPIKQNRERKELQDLSNSIRRQWDLREIDYHQFNELNPKIPPEVEIIPFIVGTIVVAVLGIIFSGLLIDFDWLKILIAPKFYLVEYAANLIKG